MTTKTLVHWKHVVSSLTIQLLLATVGFTTAYLNTEVFPPTCEGCYCVPDTETNDNGACPSPQPPTEFSFTEQLKHMKWENPILLECNPYAGPEVDNCTLTDSEGNHVEEDLGPDAVCGVLYDENDIQANNCIRSFSTKSFPDRQQLEETDYVVTHLGACGSCSSMQDLSVYIDNPNLQEAGIQCGFISLSNETAALECYQALGFSPGCAATWLYDTAFTRDNCLGICLPIFNDPPNQNVSMCPLNECINCNEEKSGDIFKRIAGRTRRGSGLLSYIIRNCSELVFDVGPIDPCPNGAPSGGASLLGTRSSVLASFATVAGAFLPV